MASSTVAPITADFFDARTRNQPTFMTRVTFAERLVVRVEDVRVCIVVRVISQHIRAEHECLEEPRDVGTMPLGRAHVGH